MKKDILGFTLLETLLATAMALVVGVILANTLVNNSGIFYKQTAIVSEGVNINDSLSAITSYIRQSSGVVSAYPEVSPIYTTGVNVLVLKLPALSSSGIIDNVYDFVVVARDSNSSNILRLQVFPNSQSIRKDVNKVLSTFLQSISFNFLDKSGAIVSPVNATSVETVLTIKVQTGSIGSNRTARQITTLLNKSP